MDERSNEWTHGIDICDMPIAKSKMFVSKTKCLEGFAWTKKRAIIKKNLQKLKAIINFNSPTKRLILHSQLSKRGRYWKIVGNEIQENIGHFEQSCSSPINNGLNLTRIHVNAITTNDVTQEFHFRLTEFTLLQFGVKSNLPKLLQNQTYIVIMVLRVLWENDDVINVINHEIVQIFTKNIVH